LHFRSSTVDEPMACAEDRTVASNQVLRNILRGRLDLVRAPARHLGDGGLVKMGLKAQITPSTKDLTRSGLT